MKVGGPTGEREMRNKTSTLSFILGRGPEMDPSRGQDLTEGKGRNRLSGDKSLLG